MVNEDKVKRLYKLAIYEKNEEKANRQIGQFYRSDYIGKEVIKSLFTGTFAYGIIIMLWVMSNWSLVLYQINTLKIVNTVWTMIILYVVFMLIYLVGTVSVYFLRYKHGQQKLDAYVADLKEAHSMFEREEKLKM